MGRLSLPDLDQETDAVGASNTRLVLLTVVGISFLAVVALLGLWVFGEPDDVPAELVTLVSSLISFLTGAAVKIGGDTKFGAVNPAAKSSDSQPSGLPPLEPDSGSLSGVLDDEGFPYDHEPRSGSSSDLPRLG